MDRFDLIIIAAALVVCTPPPPPEPVPVVPPPPGQHPPTCAVVCQHWTDLGCEEAHGTPGGAPCMEVCDNIMDSGVFEWDLECKSRVSSCDEIDACERN